jgi:ABC-type sulfate/molybdate transport systems ATPase subunit
LKRAGMAKADIAIRVAEMLALVARGLEKRKPDQLGGQRQRGRWHAAGAAAAGAARRPLAA